MQYVGYAEMASAVSNATRPSSVHVRASSASVDLLVLQFYFYRCATCGTNSTAWKAGGLGILTGLTQPDPEALRAAAVRKLAMLVWHMSAPVDANYGR